MKYVYVATAGDFTKIGIAKNPHVRIQGLAFKPAKLIYVLECVSPREVETCALLLLREHSVGGEYLDCGSRIAVAAVVYAAMEICGRYTRIMDAEPKRWAAPVDKTVGLRASAGAASRDLSP